MPTWQPCRKPATKSLFIILMDSAELSHWRKEPWGESQTSSVELNEASIPSNFPPRQENRECPQIRCCTGESIKEPLLTISQPKSTVPITVIEGRKLSTGIKTHGRHCNSSDVRIPGPVPPPSSSSSVPFWPPVVGGGHRHRLQAVEEGVVVKVAKLLR